MAIRDMVLPEFDNEMANTRKYLARLPDGQRDWKPDPKSASLGHLALHLVKLPGWPASLFTSNEQDMAVTGFGWSAELEQQPTAELLAQIDANVAATRAALAAADDAAFMEPWSLRAGEKIFFTLPRIAVVRTMQLNHLIHHRGQLSVYYRLLGIALPSIYGPTADESFGD